jgi:hypothetical protein
VKLFALVAAVVCTLSVAAQTKSGDCSIRQFPDGTATIRGTVVRNEHACERDGGCFLVLSCAGAEVTVDYVPAGDLPENTDAYRKANASDAITVALKAASGIRAGEQIEAHGPANTRKGKITGIRIYYNGDWIKVISTDGAGQPRK